jgi:hypothetical protein
MSETRRQVVLVPNRLGARPDVFSDGNTGSSGKEEMD